jgi:hypothetical protein
MALAEARFPLRPPAVPERRRWPGWQWPGLVAASLVLLTLPPMLLAAMRTPVGSVFSGYVVIARDAYVYQAIWRQGWHGDWLFHSPYTSEAMPGILLYPWYLWPAHLIGWAAGPWLYHLARAGAAAALLIAVWLLISELFRSALMRRWAYVLAALGGGVGIFLPAGLSLGPIATHATEMTSPGSSVADLIAMAPHLPWALALMCWVMVVALRLRRQFRPSELISGLAAVIGLQLIYPQLALLAIAVVAGWALLRRRGRALRFAAGAGVVQVPYLLYLVRIWQVSPAALAVIRPSLDVGDPFGFLVLSHLVASGLIAIAIWRRRLRGDIVLPALWIVGMTLFMFLPGVSSVLGRSFMASSVPFALCAAPGLLSLLRLVRTSRWRRRIAAATLAASSLYGVFSLAQPLWIAALRLDSRAEYENIGEAILLDRLAPRISADDVVLTTYLDGIFVPAQTNARAFIGHPEMTIDAPRKSAEVNAFFNRWNAASRLAFLHANGIDYVLVTDAQSVRRLKAVPGIHIVDYEQGAALFAVDP